MEDFALESKHAYEVSPLPAVGAEGDGGKAVGVDEVDTAEVFPSIAHDNRLSDIGRIHLYPTPFYLGYGRTEHFIAAGYFKRFDSLAVGS